MRIPDILLKSTAFVVSIAEDEDRQEGEYDFEGSGFLIGLRSRHVSGQSFFYFVTADHVVSNIRSKVGVRVNLRQGGTTVVPVDQWYRHPSDPSADVAVTPFDIKLEYDAAFLSEDCFMGYRVDMASKNVGIGDEVWFPGLFSLTQQESDKRNQPILRMGNIAMLPNLRIPTASGSMEAYLIEARSIGGLSGAPVFARRTISILWNDEQVWDEPGKRKPIKALHGVTGEVLLIGMVHGHWDVKESEINQVRIEPTRNGVNIGIAIVIPFSKVIETLNRPELVEGRRQAEEELARKTSPIAD
jgi:hypothetical protein